LLQKVDSEGRVEIVVGPVLIGVLVVVSVVVVGEEKKAKKPCSSTDSSEMNRTDIRLPVVLVKVMGNSSDKFPFSLARGCILRSQPSQI
jgi:hypothetical protein